MFCLVCIYLFIEKCAHHDETVENQSLRVAVTTFEKRVTI